MILVLKKNNVCVYFIIDFTIERINFTLPNIKTIKMFKNQMFAIPPASVHFIRYLYYFIIITGTIKILRFRTLLRRWSKNRVWRPRVAFYTTRTHRNKHLYILNVLCRCFGIDFFFFYVTFHLSYFKRGPILFNFMSLDFFYQIKQGTYCQNTVIIF